MHNASNWALISSGNWDHNLCGDNGAAGKISPRGLRFESRAHRERKRFTHRARDPVVEMTKEKNIAAAGRSITSLRSFRMTKGKNIAAAGKISPRGLRFESRAHRERKRLTHRARDPVVEMTKEKNRMTLRKDLLPEQPGRE